MTDEAPEGADITKVAADPAVVRAVHAEHPSLVLAVAPGTDEQARACVEAGADLLVGDAFAGVAAATGAGLVCSAPDRAAGVRRDGVLVRAGTAGEAGALAGAGHAVLADEPVPAVTAVYAWVGARVFHTTDAGATRQVLDMVASIKGTRPPAVTRRGLT